MLNLFAICELAAKLTADTSVLSAEDETAFREHLARADELVQNAFMALREAQHMHKKALSEVASIVDMIVQED